MAPGPTHREDHRIWQDFQYAFFLTGALYCYAPFFEKILYRVTKDYIKECCTIIEYRHILGCLFDDDGKQVPVEEEMAIFEKMQKNIQQFFPLFQMRIIVVGLKIVGRDQIKE